MRNSCADSSDVVNGKESQPAIPIIKKVAANMRPTTAGKLVFILGEGLNEGSLAPKGHIGSFGAVTFAS